MILIGKEIIIVVKEFCISKNGIFEIILKWCVEKRLDYMYFWYIV